MRTITAPPSKTQAGGGLVVIPGRSENGAAVSGVLRALPIRTNSRLTFRVISPQVLILPRVAAFFARKSHFAARAINYTFEGLRAKYGQILHFLHFWPCRRTPPDVFQNGNNQGRQLEFDTGERVILIFWGSNDGLHARALSANLANLSGRNGGINTGI